MFIEFRYNLSFRILKNVRSYEVHVEYIEWIQTIK